ERMPVTTAMSESTSIHSATLESGIDLGPGLYFSDGKRKVDYILCYKYKKRRASKSRLSIASNGSIPAPLPGRWDNDPDAGAGEPEESKLTEEEKALMRDEFEAGLVEAGLQLEREKERSNGLGFIRLHIPWSILSREAELQKIKVPVKKVSILHEEWANYGVMHKYQPVDLIRKYFGEQIGLYFAWLGVYTQLLIPPSVLGIIVFLYGIFTVDANVPSQETCNESLNITMCPLCDGVCDYWQLSTVCSLARASYLFDNGATVLFMNLWYTAACFLEHWKRRQMCLKHAWDLTSLEDEEVVNYTFPEAKICDKGKLRECQDRTLFGVAVYRICMLSVWSMNPDPEAKASVRMTVTTTGIVLNMLVVLVLEEVYGAIAVWLTELELPKTKEEFEERLIFKSFFLKSMNAFAPIFYVAFFKGRFAGRPGDYVYVFGDYRMEECAPPGCLIELCIQLSMIMLGKQLIQNNVFEVLIPYVLVLLQNCREFSSLCKRPKQQFHKDFVLEPFEGVTPEYMEMIIQYGFVSLFVASFPLAPAFALLNNVIEIRLDAGKFVTEIRRPDAVRCKGIGIWYNILCGISKFSVITNAFVISFTSEFVPRMVYQYMYSTNGTMTGYTDHSLSYFNVSNFPPGTAPANATVSMCRYKDYRDPPWGPDAYTFSKQYWSILAAKLAFVIFFQNLAMFLSMLVAWMIPDVPRSLREQLKRENMMLMEFLLNQDQETRAKTRSPRCSVPCFPTSIDIVVEEPLEHPEGQQAQKNEEDDGDGEANINLDEHRDTPDSDPEIGKSFLEAAENKDELQGIQGEDVHEENEGGQKETDKELNELNEKEDNEEKGEEEKVEGEKRKDEENFTVDLDAFMNEMGILGEWRKI
uniref:Anoctamin n=1 Tax=Sphaeramia orbicularis TaxID=375764 RepID=A0A673AEP8_9TELE